METSECINAFERVDKANIHEVRKGNIVCPITLGPENNATALLTTHCQRADTCKKPGTAFTMEYQIPGTDARTL
eukprot:3026692-Amphidinium_carterae.1